MYAVCDQMWENREKANFTGKTAVITGFFFGDAFTGYPVANAATITQRRW